MKCSKRILSLVLAVMMVSALVLNVSAASYYNEYAHEANNRPHTHYAIASCTSSAARAETASDYAGEYTQTSLAVYVRVPGAATCVFDRTTDAQTRDTSLSHSNTNIAWCDTVHKVDGIQFYGQKLLAD